MEHGALIVKQFQNLDIQVYGTHDEPLFKAKDIGELLGIQNIRKTIDNLDKQCKVKLNVTNGYGGNSDTWFLTEDGLYEVLFISRKPIAKKFKLWVRSIIKEIRLRGKYELEEKLKDKLLEKDKVIEQVQSELDKYKQVDYEQVDTTGFVYVITTDRPNVYKVGTSKNVKNRTMKLQTANVEDIQVLFQFATSNGKILEEAVHFVLDRYRTNSNREHFWADKEYIIKVIKILGNSLDTLKSCFHNIDHDKMMQLVIDGLLKKPIENNILEPINETLNNQNIIVDTNVDNVDEFVADEDFWEWLDNAIVYNQEKCVIKLIDIVNFYTGDYSFSKFNSQIMQHYKTQFQEYIRQKYPDIRWFQHTIRYNNKSHKGWNNLKFCN